MFTNQPTKLMAWQLQSSVHGKIRRLLMSEGNDNDRTHVHEIILKVYQQKSSHTQLVVWCNFPSRREAFEIFLSSRELDLVTTFDSNNTDPSKILILSPESDHVSERTEFTVFIRDSFLIYEQPNEPFPNTLALNTCETLDQNYLLAEKLEENKLVTETMDYCDIKFEGGDVLTDGYYVLIGPNIALRTSTVEPSEARELIAKQLGYPVEKLINIVLEEQGGIYAYSKIFNRSSWFYSIHQNLSRVAKSMPFEPNLVHIDMFITLTGVLVGSQFPKPVLLLAKLQNLGINNANTTDLNNDLDRLEGELSKYYLVLRNAVPCVYLPDGKWMYLCYNNCLVENTDLKKTVWLPCYQCSLELDAVKCRVKDIQDFNEQLWKALGFDVKFIQADFVKVTLERGSLHCLTKELNRY
jgi:hypothetical protein